MIITYQGVFVAQDAEMRELVSYRTILQSWFYLAHNISPNSADIKDKMSKVSRSLEGISSLRRDRGASRMDSSPRQVILWERKKRTGEKLERWWSNEDKHDADTNSNNKNSCKDEMNQKSHIFESKVILKTMNIFFDKMTEDFFARWPNWWWRCWSAGSRWDKRHIQRWSVFITIYKHNFDEMINNNNNNNSKRRTQHWSVVMIMTKLSNEDNNSKKRKQHWTVFLKSSSYIYIVRINIFLLSYWAAFTLQGSSQRGGLAAERPSTGGNTFTLHFHFHF